MSPAIWTGPSPRRSHWFGTKYAFRLTAGHKAYYSDLVRGLSRVPHRALGLDDTAAGQQKA
jgi:hypothetical protein